MLLILVSVILEILPNGFLPIIIYADFSCVRVTVHVTVRWNVHEHTVTIYKKHICVLVDVVDKSVEKLEYSKNIFRKTIDMAGRCVTIRPR